MKRFAFASTVLVSTSVSVAACDFGDGLSAAEFRSALEESVEGGEVQQLENGIIEITTDFAIGDAIAQIRQHVEDVLAACGSTQVTAMDELTIAIDFGPASDPCAYQGKSYSGVVEFVVVSDSDSVDVAHTYRDLSNGTYTLNGTQNVSWTSDAPVIGGVVERASVADVVWDGPRGRVDYQAERTTTFLDWLGGPTQRIQIDGQHDWQRDDADWRLDVDEVEFRLVDPVPQSGVYTVTLPNGKQASLRFERFDEDTIEVTASGTRRDLVFHVNQAGVIVEK